MKLTPASPTEFGSVFGSMSSERRAAFEEVWRALLEVHSAELALRSLETHKGLRDGTHDPDECAACCSSRSWAHNARQEARNRLSDCERELRVQSGVYESVRRPPRPGSQFYVTTDRGHLVAGPYRTHEEAIRTLPEARKRAQELDRTAFNFAFGTSAVLPENPGEWEPGILNPYL